MSGPLVLVAQNEAVATRLRALAAKLGCDLLVVSEASLGDSIAGREPIAVVVDVDAMDFASARGTVQRLAPSALAAAFVSMPDRDRWEAAVAEYDLVATRGAIASQLEAKLATWTSRPAASRIRLFDERDAAGRLGLVHTVSTDSGPAAIYHVGKHLYAVGDVCPHAGATLSEGAIEGTTLTCPRHGSQFDLRNGARVRGPSDEPIPSYRVVVDGGVVYLELEEETG